MTTQLKDTFQLLLDEFYKIIDGYPEKEKVTQQINDLNGKATLAELTYHQKDAILARCKNYLKGEYGDQVKRTNNRSDYSLNLK